MGRVPRYPSLPNMLLDFEVIGPIARTVDDVALLLSVISGPDRRDRSSLGVMPARAAKASDALRILYVERFGDAPLDREVASSVREAVAVFESFGCRVERGALPLDLARINDFWSRFGAVGVAHVMQQHPGRERDLGPRFQAMLAEGRDVPAADYLAFIEAVQRLRRESVALFESFDLVITPSAAALPWPAETPFPDRIDDQPVGPRGHAVYTGWVNVCALPGVNVPCAPSRSGLPIGLQLVGDFGADDSVLDVARRFEAAQPWSQRWPALASEVA